MAIKEIRYFQVTCDYPTHNAELAKGDECHVLEGNVVICSNCWDNRLTVEILLALLEQQHETKVVGRDKGV